MGNEIITKYNITGIDEIIKSIPKEQLKILRAIWDYFLHYKNWPKGKSFRKDHGRPIIEKLTTNLEPIFIYHIKNNQQEDYYRLTTEGVYAIESVNGPNIKLLLSYLDYIRKKFNKNPEFEKLTSKELKEVLNINSEETRIIGEFLDMGNSHLYGRSATNLCSSDWDVGVMNDIEILDEINNSQEFLYKQWSDNIERMFKYHSHEIPNILKIKNFQSKKKVDSSINELYQKTTKVDQFVKKCKNHPLIGILIILVVIIIGLGTFTDSMDKIIKFVKNYIIIEKEPLESNSPRLSDKNLINRGVPIAVFVPNQSYSKIEPFPDGLRVDFNNIQNGTGVAFKFSPKLDVRGFSHLELRGTSINDFHFLIEYKILINNRLTIVKQSENQLFRSKSEISIIRIPLAYDGIINEIVINFFTIGESSQVIIKSIRLL